jgi:hypothetical protein
MYAMNCHSLIASFRFSNAVLDVQDQQSGLSNKHGHYLKVFM